MFGKEVDGFGPGFTEERVVLRVDEAREGDGAAVDDGGGVDGQVRGGGGEEGRGEAGLAGRGELVEVVARGFPVLVEAEREVERRLAAEPGNVGGDLGGAGVAVVAVEVDGFGVFAGAEREAGGVEEGDEKPGGAMVEGASGEELEQGEGAGGFVAVDAGGEVDARVATGGARRLPPRRLHPARRSVPRENRRHGRRWRNARRRRRGRGAQARF